ncbi:hypothetical protein LTR70_001529 [Exophiala xenobiotica]|uniref:Nuclear speckle splicing regulatory protein 1 N-terminal domain-containing protein n=1 Tax=Lithohypha guttulata TaxID=1690604 RepID=A0ABR0K8X4_9EURO|nr:hypothetical protein LTR24_005950 [Lithohypha guttulata]KAK5327906.1 hypothetical protein LTR70_001529 [Exophiala xenobiotica]
MPALAFGLRSAKTTTGPDRLPAKRKAVFDGPEEDAGSDDNDDAFGALFKPKPKLQAKPKALNNSDQPPRKSPKLGDEGTEEDGSKYSNLSALRSAKLQDTEASKLDASVYDYDAVYDTFAADKKKKEASKNGSTEVPKYMSNLMASAEVRKRDQLRAKERALQKERETEGDEFADKEKFVTGAYKQQQEEQRKLDEEEKKREEEEEERRKKGGGMTAFHKDLLKKDEERQRAVEEATREAQARKDQAGVVETGVEKEEDEKTDVKVAAELNEQGGRVMVNDEGEIVDKRQLLTAGLNVAPKKPGVDTTGKKIPSARSQEWQRPSKQQDVRNAQRERQSRMMERQIEEIEAKQKEVKLAEQKEREVKNKSKLTESDKLSAKERYLQRKREREEEARKAKAGAG